MKLKIYKTIALIFFWGMILQSSFAQQPDASAKKQDAESQKADAQEMKKLQQNIRELQKQVMELRQKHAQEKAKEWDKQSFNFQGFNLQLDSLQTNVRALVDTKIKGLDKLYSYNFPSNSLTFLNGSAIKSDKKNVIEKTKTLSKTYSVNKNDKLTINNQYGKITVNTWNKNEFKVDVEIKVGTEDESETQKLLDGVEIVSAQNQDGVSFKTNISSQNNNNNNSIFSFRRASNFRSISVNYTVFMPVKNALDITNRYGSVILPDLEGKVTVQSFNGNLSAKELSNVANNIRVQYGNANIESLNGGDLNFQYGNLKIGTANNLNAVAGYSPINIDRLKSSAKIKVNYGGGLKIDNLDKNLKSLDIDANFSNVSLDLNGSENFLFDVTVNHNDFNYNNSAVKLLDQPNSDQTKRFNFSKNYKGYVGKASSDNKVTIKSNFQRVSFN